MKKSLIIFFLIIFDCLIIFQHNKLVFAAQEVTNPNPTPTSSTYQPTSINAPQNPAPPLIGNTPCGNTVCLENEVCVMYPADKDEHCVPVDIDPSAISADPIKNKLEDCNKLIGNNQSVFPPNSKCWNNTVMVQSDLSKFDKTCIYQPVIKYTDTRYLKTKGSVPGFEECGNGNNPFGGSPPGDSKQDKCYVGVLVYTDVRDATLGSYGPDEKTIQENSGDYLAQNYLYNSLFGRPNTTVGANKESYRTYWRLIPAENQANLRSFTLNMSKQGLMENTNFEFDGKSEKTDLVDLYDQLSKQITVFLHPPFIRIGCLTDYPVCPEFAKAISDFNTPVSDTIAFVNNFPFPIVLEEVLNYFGSITDDTNQKLATKYSSFVPLDFSSVRSYIFRKPTEETESKIYNGELDGLSSFNGKLVDGLNQPRYGTNKPLLNSITSESTPYVGAIYQGLMSPKFGLINSLHPQWLIETYTNPEESVLYDYSAGNTPSDYPEVKIAKKNLIERAISEAKLLLKNPLSWAADILLGNKNFNEFNDTALLPKGYNEPRVENKKTDVKNYYQNMLDCPLPVSYHISAPFTANLSKDPLKSVSKDDHHQVIYIRGNNVKWDFDPEKWEIVEDKVDPKTGITYQVVNRCPKNDEHFQKDGEPNTCYKRRWQLTAIEKGNALTVLNNPKQSDIKKSVVSEAKFSLYNTLLPSTLSVKKITEANIDAPIARNFVSQNGGGDAVGPAGEAEMLNPAEPINRVNNFAQDSVHLLQNCWSVPDNLQNSPRCKIALTDASASACTGEKFKELIGDNNLNISEKGKQLYSLVESKLTDDLITAYAEAEKQTGVPCEVLAGIHYREADNSPTQDLQSGAPLGGRSLTESAIQAANELLGKAGGKIGDIDTLIKALSWYNGGGNANCQPTTSCSAIKNNRCGSKVACDNLPSTATSAEVKSACSCGVEAGSCRSQCNSGYPFLIPTSPGLCPPPSIGYDDPYVVELWKKQHEKMYVLYQYDCTQTPPINQNRLGTFTFAVSFYQSNADPSSGPSTAVPAQAQ